MKLCKSCKTNKPISEFYKHSMTADGCYTWCKICHNERCKQNRHSDIVAYRKKQRERAKDPRQKGIRKRAYERHLLSGKHTEETRAWREGNPEKYQAHLEVKRAIYNGVIKRTGCVVCGEKAQAHHEDYSKPLEVMWLCHVHHADHHMRKRNDIQS